MQVQHLAIDGSIVEIEAEATLDTGATAAGWAIVPSLLRSYPLSVHPAGYTRIVERAVTSNLPQVKIRSTEEFSLKDGQLRVAEIELPGPGSTTRQLTVAGWEGQSGCLITSLTGLQTRQLVQVFDTLRFRQTEAGVVVDSPIAPTPRPPEIAKEIPGLGIITVRPATVEELRRVPKATGYRTQTAELFRLRQEGQGLMMVSRSAVVTITPDKQVTSRVSASNDSAQNEDTWRVLKEAAATRLQIAAGLRIEWRPRQPQR